MLLALACAVPGYIAHYKCIESHSCPGWTTRWSQCHRSCRLKVVDALGKLLLVRLEDRLVIDIPRYEGRGRLMYPKHVGQLRFPGPGRMSPVKEHSRANFIQLLHTNEGLPTSSRTLFVVPP